MTSEDELISNAGYNSAIVDILKILTKENDKYLKNFFFYSLNIRKQGVISQLIDEVKSLRKILDKK